MKQLTLHDKKVLMGMLHKHYTINESAFIKAIAQNEEEEVELTLKAFSLAQRTQEAKAKLMIGKSTTSNSPYASVQITKLSGRLQLVKAVKDITKWSLKEAKDFVDTIVSFKRIPATGIFEYAYKPFRIGPNERITVRQWKAIAGAIPNDDIKWYFV